MWMRTVLVLLAAFLASIGHATALPGASQWVRSEAIDVRLISAAATTGDAATVPLGLHFRLADGWKIYWRTPGDAGLPPRLETRRTENIRSLDWQWPVPERFNAFGFENYGYGGEVVFPVVARLSEPGRPLAIDASVNALVCNEICIPFEADLALALPAGPNRPTALTQLVDRFRARVPGAPDGTGLSVTGVITPRPGIVSIALAADQPLARPDVFIEAGPEYAFGKPTVMLADDRLSAAIDVPVTAAPQDVPLSGVKIELTVVDDDRFFAVPARIAASATPPSRKAAPGPRLWLAMLGLALLGGLILNLMPCVLPVLSLKLLQVLRYSGVAQQTVRAGFLASSAGILASFLVLAGGAIALKSAGVAVGWGFQFQQPVFLTVMVIILAGFSANLFGLFEIPMPAFLSRVGGSVRAPEAPSLAGHALSGAFATLLATPCSAPFLGTALGFALARGPIEILAIFLFMGIGLALPYLLVAAFPGLVRMLPRPGPWITRLRAVLGLALIATSIWLLAVIANQIPVASVAVIVASLLLAGLFLVRIRRQRRRFLPAGAAALVVLALVVPVIGPGPDTGPATGTTTDVNWQVFDRQRLDELVSAGRVVLVDVTADWCLTCKVNKALVLDQNPILERLLDHEITAMRADWTTPDSAIADYLASFGRYGIPFNAVYGPAHPEGVALPELLQSSVVLDAFRQASGG